MVFLPYEMFFLIHVHLSYIYVCSDETDSTHPFLLFSQIAKFLHLEQTYVSTHSRGAFFIS
jgi:hypothetical protein